MYKGLLFVFCMAIFTSNAQSVSLSTLNIGGGTIKLNNGLQVDWSIGEGTSVQSFTGTNGLLVNAGILQPFTINADFLVYNGSTNWLAGELVSYPVPTQNILQVDIKIPESGRIDLRLMDGSGKTFIVRSFEYNKTNGSQRFDLSALPSGNYYIEATLSHPYISVTTRRGVFKLIKQ